MTIVCISSLSDTHGAEIARATSERLGYAYCDLETAIHEASERYGVPEERLARACHETPSLFGMQHGTRRRLLAYLQAAVAARLAADDLVHLGLLARSLAMGISHMMKVRLVASMEERVARRVRSEQCTEREAERRIRHDDKLEAALARHVYGHGELQDTYFDLVIDTSAVDVEQAVTTIVDTARQPRYQSMTYSVACMRDIELASRLRAELVDLDPDVEVEARGGAVRVRLRDAGRNLQKRQEEAQERASKLAGVAHVDVLIMKSPI
jgi:cytidylate kinase